MTDDQLPYDGEGTVIIDREAGVALTATQRMQPMAQIPYCDVVFTAVCTTYRVF